MMVCCSPVAAFSNKQENRLDDDEDTSWWCACIGARHRAPTPARRCSE